MQPNAGSIRNLVRHPWWCFSWCMSWKDYTYTHYTHYTRVLLLAYICAPSPTDSPNLPLYFAAGRHCITVDVKGGLAMLCNVWIRGEEKNCCDLTSEAQGDSCSPPKEHFQEICCKWGSGNQNSGGSFYVHGRRNQLVPINTCCKMVSRIQMFDNVIKWACHRLLESSRRKVRLC